MTGGGRPDGRDKGFFVEPTLIVGIGNDSPVAQEEIFGPVLVVIPHDGDDDAVAIANDSPYGLSGSVWSGDRDRAIAVAERIRTGTVGRQRRPVVQPRRALRRLQAVGHRAGDGRGRVRGVPRDQVVAEPA